MQSIFDNIRRLHNSPKFADNSTEYRYSKGEARMKAAFSRRQRSSAYSAALKLYTGRMRSMISAVGPIWETISSRDL